MKSCNKDSDYTTTIRAAGANLAQSNKIEDCLNIHTIDDAIETVLGDAGLHKVPLQSAAQRMRNSRNPGIFTEIRKLIRPREETRYQTLLKELRETTWESHWTKELGRTRNPIGGLPTTLKDDFVFGTPTSKSLSVKELLSPNITPLELDINDDEFHALYRRTHNKCLRNYGPPFDPKNSFGKLPRKTADIKCAMNWFDQEPVKMANKVLADYIDRTHARLGTCLCPNDNTSSVPSGHRFGISNAPNYYGVSELIQPNATNCNFRKDFRAWLCSLNEIRMAYKKRAVDFTQLYGQCRYADANQCDWIPLQTFADILMRNKLAFPRTEIIPLAICFTMYKDEMVHYRLLLDLFNMQIPVADLARIDENCDRGRELVSNYRLQYCFTPAERKDIVPAGVPTLPSDLESKSIVNPSVFTNYGVNHADLMIPRDAAFMKTLFLRVGYSFPDDTFAKLWEIGQRYEGQENVSVETFRGILEQATPITVKDVPMEQK